MANRKRKSDEELLEEVEGKRKALEARQQTLKARIAKRERALDTRRKILIGSFILQRLDTAADADLFAKLRTLIRDELPGFLRPTDRVLFTDLLGEPEDADAGPALKVEDVLSRLGAERRRCTYGAIAGVLCINPTEVGPLLGGRRTEASWVVSVKTGRPTGYAPEQTHQDLERQRARRSSVARRV